MWPAPGTIRSTAPADAVRERLGVRQRRLLVVLADERRASARSISPRRLRTSCVGRNSTAARRPSARDPRHRGGNGGDCSGIDVRRHDRAQHRLGHARGRLPGVEGVEAQPLPGLRIGAVEPERGARVEQGERAHASGVAQGGVERDLPAHREAGDVRLAPPRASSMRPATASASAGNDSPSGGHRRRAVAGHVPGDAAVVRSERRELGVEARARHAEPVQEQHERPGARLAPGHRRGVDVPQIRHDGDLRAPRRGRSGRAARGTPRRSRAA